MTVLQTCRRHPNRPPFMATCGGCAQELHDAMYPPKRIADQDALARKVRLALGLSASHRPDPELGETPTRIAMWSQLELNTIFERVGGVVTSRQVQRCWEGDRTTTETEITLTVDLPGIGRVEAVTDWYEDYTAIGGDRNLPLMRALETTAV